MPLFNDGYDLLPYVPGHADVFLNNDVLHRDARSIFVHNAKQNAATHGISTTLHEHAHGATCVRECTTYRKGQQ